MKTGGQPVEFTARQPDALEQSLGDELPEVRRFARSPAVIAEIGSPRVGVQVGGKPDVLARLTAAEGTPARTGEPADGHWPEVGCVKKLGGARFQNSTDSGTGALFEIKSPPTPVVAR